MTLVGERGIRRIVAAAVGGLLVQASSGCGSDCIGCATFAFRDVAAEAGVALDHVVELGGLSGLESQSLSFTGGIAAADYDGDGWVDLYAIGGASAGNRLFRNQANGAFEDVTATAGVARHGRNSAGAVFVDYDGDGLTDLWVGGVAGTTPALYHNLGGGVFEDRFAESGLVAATQNLGAAFADVDLDGDLDAVFAHWGSPSPEGAPLEHLWINRLNDSDSEGEAAFTPAGAGSGVELAHPTDWLFTPRFTDVNGDGRQDLLAVGDFGTTRAYLGNGDATFEQLDPALFTDENGMGTTAGDFDGDGDIDWVVTSIFGPPPDGNGNWGTSGNRFYENVFRGSARAYVGNAERPIVAPPGGLASFVDATEEAGLRVGHWGWGACRADFDLDGDLDVFQVNGIDFGSESPSRPFHDNPALFYVNDGTAVFSDRATEAGLDDRGQGRGVACFDYDRDGDVDIAVSNNNGPLRLYRNDSRTSGRHLLVRVRAAARNRAAIGARVTLHAADGSLQVREIGAGGGFVSHDPPEAHFGIPRQALRVPERLVVRGPDGCRQETTEFPSGGVLIVDLTTGGCK